jgi:hypothetical protein
MTDMFSSTLIRFSKLGHAEDRILPSFQRVLSDCTCWLSEGPFRLGSGFCVGVDFPIHRRPPKTHTHGKEHMQCLPDRWKYFISLQA